MGLRVFENTMKQAISYTIFLSCKLYCPSWYNNFKIVPIILHQWLIQAFKAVTQCLKKRGTTFENKYGGVGKGRIGLWLEREE